jgi:hypothetical protein
VSAIPTANKGEDAAAISAINAPCPSAVAYVVNACAIFAIAPRLNLFAMKYLPFAMLAEWSSCWNFSA